MKPKPPCLDCQDRRDDCHDEAVCSAWADYRKACIDFTTAKNRALAAHCDARSVRHGAGKRRRYPHV